MVGGCLVGFVEGVGFGEFSLVVLQASLLDWAEYREFVSVVCVVGSYSVFEVSLRRA